MTHNQGKSVASVQVVRAHFHRVVLPAIVSLACLISLPLPAQSPAHRAASPPKASATPSELTARLAAARAARDSNNPAATAAANQRLIATALDDLASLRVVEAALPQAIELYASSLQFEDTPGTQLDMASADVQAGKYDDAIKLAQQVRATGSKDLRIDRVLASANVQNGNYAQAVAPFTAIAHADPTVENLYPLAMCLLETHKPEDKRSAEAVFEQMKQSSGDSGSLHVLFGRAYRDAEDMPSAIREFQRAVAIDPKTPHAHYFLGLAQLYLKEWKPTPEAEAELRKEIEYYPHDYLANYMLGFIVSGERRYDEANRYLEAAAQINATVPEPFLYLGLNAYSQENMPRAEEMLRKAVALTGTDEARSNYQIRRAYVELGRILALRGAKDESEVYLKKARDLQNRTMEESQQQVSSVLLAGGAGSAAAAMPLTRQQENLAAPLPEGGNELFARVDATTRSASKLTPAQQTAAEAEETTLRSVLGLAFNDLGTAQAIEHQYAQALGSYQQAEHWDSTLAGLERNLGQSAFRAGDYPEAIRGLSLAIRQDPAATPLRALLGMAYFATNKYADAAQTFAPLGERGMADSEIGYAWAASLAHTGDMTQASAVLAAFEAQPRPEETMLLVGQLWTEIGDYKRATATLDRALAANPSLPRAHFYEGLAYIRSEHWPEAAQQFQAELAIAPNDPDAQYHLGFVEMQQSKTDDALVLFRQVIAAHPNYANAQYQIGKILLDRGQAADSVGYLEAAARLQPQTDYLHYQLQAAYRKENRVADADRELEIYKQIKAKSRGNAAQAVKPN